MLDTSFSKRLKIINPQGRLLALAALFLVLFALILTLSPAARLRSWEVSYRLSHWIGVLVWGAAVYILYRQLQEHAPNHDPLLVPLAALLSGWGMLSIWRLTGAFGLRQSVWLAVSTGLFVAGLRYKDSLATLRRYKYLWLFSGLALTTLTLILGTNPLGYGPRLWLGCCGIYLQPSEPLKLLLIVYLAAYLADRQPLMPTLLPLLAPTVVMAGLALLLLTVQRDLGTAFIFLFLYAGVIYAATGKRRLLLITAGALLVAGIGGYLVFDLIRLRVDAWLNPWLDPSGRSYQIVQSLMAVGAGGLLGRGPGMGSPSLVPISHSDFIFSTIAEETGLVGTIALFALLALFTLRGLRLAMRAKNHYHRYLAIGLSLYLGGQSILIIGGTIRLLPLTGVTLPFVSYGGSSLVTSFLALLLLVKISGHASSLNLPPKDHRATQHLAAMLLLGFAAAALVNGWWSFVRGPDLQTRTDNARRAIADRYVPRGSLLAYNGDPLHVTVGEVGSYQRSYLYPAFSSVLGYTHPVYGQAGVEASLDPLLRGLEMQSGSDIWIQHLLYGQTPPGLDIRLTLDLDMQGRAADLLNDTPGAVLLLDAEGGHILAMVSSPSFNPNMLDEGWLTLIEDKNSPLVNRATLGQYQPGPALGPLLLAAGIPGFELPPHTADPYPLGEITLACAQTPSAETWGAAVRAGCPAPLEEIGIQSGGEELLALFQQLGFYTPPEIRLVTAAQAPPLTIATPGKEAIGQGELRLSPLQMALAAATLSNQGQIPAPLLVFMVKSSDDRLWMDYPPMGETVQVYTSGQASVTATALAHPELPLWETTALAFNNPDQPLSWYLGGTLPGAEQPLVVVVLLETGQFERAAFIGRQLLLEAMP
ncbi:FtsW/RodA/SpoVE family cell cycle protein [Chloroflexota bacterium]